MERTQFTFYASIYESACRIKNKAARADFYDAICAYALAGTPPDLDKLSDAAAVGFIAAKPNLDASRKKAKSGKAGGSVKQTASKPQANAKQTPSEKEEEKEGEKEKEVEVEKENEIENECYLSSSATAEEDTAAAFERFWNLYPNRIAREDARQIFFSLCLSGDELNQLFQGLARWNRSVEWTKSNGQFIPRPAKWLSDRRWTEFPKETTPKGASGTLGKAELDAINQLFQEDEDHA